MVLLSTPAASAAGGDRGICNANAERNYSNSRTEEGERDPLVGEGNSSFMHKLRDFRTIVACWFSYMPECHQQLEELAAAAPVAAEINQSSDNRTSSVRPDRKRVE
jgi:hypothetical protein